MLKFLVDTQLPPRLATFLTEQGHDALHTTSFPDGHLLHDAEIRAIALKQERIIITKDSDFHDYYMAKGIPPRLIYLTLGNIANTDLLRLFTQNLVPIITAFTDHSADIIVMNRAYLLEY
ncbi:MAG: DUF5615 family PIN-like protein [Candidatus Kapabacteria bacterium]|nr:DUF5615 family PIN-like protein [Candidatus Kapabacteria bacterium]